MKPLWQVHKNGWMDWDSAAVTKGCKTAKRGFLIMGLCDKNNSNLWHKLARNVSLKTDQHWFAIIIAAIKKITSNSLSSASANPGLQVLIFSKQNQDLVQAAAQWGKIRLWPYKVNMSLIYHLKMQLPVCMCVSARFRSSSYILQVFQSEGNFPDIHLFKKVNSEVK